MVIKAGNKATTAKVQCYTIEPEVAIVTLSVATAMHEVTCLGRL